MKKIIIWGCGWLGAKLWKEKIRCNDKYELIGWADNSSSKNKYKIDDKMIYTLAKLKDLKKLEDFSVIIASVSWCEIGRQLEDVGIRVEGIYLEQDILPYKQMKFSDLELHKDIILYAGDIYDEYLLAKENLYGLSINKGDAKHIFHDITWAYPLPDESIFAYQAEDVLEHIEYDKVVSVINEIYRILKKGSVFRISMPDYNSPLLNAIVMRDDCGNILYDPLGGGNYDETGVINGGHVWFPTYPLVKELLQKTRFTDIRFGCYYTEKRELIMNDFSDEYGYVKRVRGEKEVFSMVIDCYK